MEIARSTGLAFLSARARRARLAHSAFMALSGLTGHSEWTFLIELLGALGLWVYDLQASERYHHRRPFGLFDHSLEVAADLARDLDRRWRGSGRALQCRPPEWALWSRVGFALALFHDLGKTQDVTVTATESGEVWSPLVEPLLFFRVRHGLGSSEPTPFRYQKGRGPWGHEAGAKEILPALLLGTLGDPLRPFLDAALTAYLQRLQPSRGPSRIPLDYLIVLVQQADRESGWRDKIACAREASGPAEERTE